MDEQLGKTGEWFQQPGIIPRVRIGDTVFTGTGVNVRRYRDHARRLIVEIELVDGLAL